MTILTALVLIVAVGALVQGNGDGESLLGASKKYAAKDDTFPVRAGRVQMLNVLANDTNSDRISPSDLVVVDAPICGTARVLGGKIEFLGQANCAGNVTFTYCVSTEEECEPAFVTLDVRNVGQTPVISEPVVAEAEPVKEGPVAEAENVASAESAIVPQVAEQPMQLVVPSDNEGTEPEEAVAAVRMIPEATENVDVASTLDSNSNISTEPAIAASVETDGIELQAPSIGGQDSGVQLASTPSSPAVPATVSNPSQMTVVELGPDAQQQAPVQARVSVPDDSGILASIANSNTLIGATFSAARTFLDEPVQESDTFAAAAPTNSPARTQLEIVGSGDIAANAEIDVTETPLPRAERDIVAQQQPAITVASVDPSESVVIDMTPAEQPVREVENEVESEEPLAVASIDPEATSERPAISFVQPEASLDCVPELTLEARPGATVVATLSAPCRAGNVVRFSHEALQFNAQIDASGDLDIEIPAFAENAMIEVAFADGQVVEEEVFVQDVDRFIRVAVVWTAPVDLNLHAYEFGASGDQPGHVWQGNAQDYRTARRNGGGFLVKFGLDDELLGAKAEVYSVPRSARTRDGLIELSLEVADSSAACNEKISVQSMRTENADLSLDPGIQISLGECGVAENLVVPNAINDLRIARN